MFLDSLEAFPKNPKSLMKINEDVAFILNSLYITYCSHLQLSLNHGLCYNVECRSSIK